MFCCYFPPNVSRFDASLQSGEQQPPASGVPHSVLLCVLRLWYVFAVGLSCVEVSQTDLVSST